MSRTLNDIIGSSEFKCFFELMLRDAIGGQLFGNGTRKVVVILNNSHWQTMSKNDCMAVNNTTSKVFLC